MTFDQIGREPIGLTRGRAVADRDQLDLMPRGKPGQHRDGMVPLPFRCMRVDGVRRDHLARGIDHRHLDTGAQAGVEAQGRARAGRCRQQQVMEIRRKDLDRLRRCGLTQAMLQLQIQSGQQFDPPGHANTVAQPGIGRTARVAHVEALCDQALRMGASIRVVLDLQVEEYDALVARTQQRQSAVQLPLPPPAMQLQKRKLILMLFWHQPDRQKLVLLKQ